MGAQDIMDRCRDAPAQGITTLSRGGMKSCGLQIAARASIRWEEEHSSTAFVYIALVSTMVKSIQQRTVHGGQPTLGSGTCRQFGSGLATRARASRRVCQLGRRVSSAREKIKKYLVFDIGVASRREKIVSGFLWVRCRCRGSLTLVVSHPAKTGWSLHDNSRPGGSARSHGFHRRSFYQSQCGQIVNYA